MYKTCLIQSNYMKQHDSFALRQALFQIVLLMYLYYQKQLVQTRNIMSLNVILTCYVSKQIHV